MSQIPIKKESKEHQVLTEEISHQVFNSKQENEFLNVKYINSDYQLNYPNNSKELNKKEDLKKNNLDHTCLTLNLIGFILYIISLYRCNGGQENYCVSGFVKIFIFLAILDFIDAFLVSITIILMFMKKIKIYHLFYLLPFYIILYIYDHGDDFNRHGSFSMMIFLIFLLIFVLLISFIIFIFGLIIKRNYVKLLIIIFIILLPFQYVNYITKVSSCDYWDEGLNFTKLKNNPNSKCIFITPPNCKMQYYHGKLDLSKLINVPNFNKKTTAVQYLSKDLKKSNYLGYPYTNRIPVKNIFDNFFFHNFVPENMINMETFIETKENPRPEITVKFNDKGIGKIEINLQKNKTLSLERKKLENPNSKYKNILIIYIDSISRSKFLLSLKKLSQFIEKFMTLKEENFSSYQFFKYQSLGTYTHINVQPMFYGNSMKSKLGIDFAKYAKENGYITGQTNNHCAHTLFNDEKKYGTKNVESIFWDHENFALFCDPNYYDKKFSSSYNRGPSSFTKRIFYNKNAFEYEFEYLKQFWEAYFDNRKLFRMSFMDGHEDTGEVIKYLDRPLTDFLFEFYYNGYLNDTFIMFVSDHGLHFPRVYGILAYENYDFERNLPALFIISGRNFDNGDIILNQQKMITAYDIFNTFIHVIYGDDFESRNVHSRKGGSLFKFIDERNRSCDLYEELINSDNCRCY